jgi:type II secretory pathway pseudopilin PulG
MEMREATSRRTEAGMTLIEATVAILVLTIGVTAVAAVFVNGLRQMSTSQDTFIAKEKAEEAIESVFAGRDDQSLQWADIVNVVGVAGASGGKFLDGPQDIKDPGPDGLVNTIDDGAEEYIVLPGPDGVYGTADDVEVPLYRFKREIKIRDAGIPNVSLRTLTVTITNSATGTVIYQISTYISPYT